MRAHTFRLVGVGGATKGLVHDLVEDAPSVVGRDPDCEIILGDRPGAGDLTAISRHHLVVEWSTKTGWSVYDSGSTNGTSLLKQGIPPTIPLTVSRRYPLESGDVIELAGSRDFQFIFQAVPVRPAAAEAGTQLLLRTAYRSIQHLVDGHSVDVKEVEPGGLSIVCPPSGAPWLESAGPSPSASTASASASTSASGSAEEMLRFSLSRSEVSVKALAVGVSMNMTPLPHGTSARLRDRDLLALDAAPRSTFLFLNPEELEPRMLSDVLLGADRVTLGAAADNTCRLIDPSLSRHHAQIWREAGALIVRDLGSANGTVVNDRRIAADYSLTEGSRIWFGRLPFIADAACWRQEPRREVSIDLRFVGLSVEIAGRRRLHGVSFAARQGEMIGLLGPSASGKSTLLKALAGHQSIADGDVYINGRSMRGGTRTGGWYRSLMGFGPDTSEVGFVQQIDLLQPGLTVREILAFAGKQMGLSAADTQQRADRAAELCNLRAQLDRVAVSGNGQLNLSGGQLKRVCVAIEVLRQPRVWALDEPTTGQDPKNTNDLMSLFRSVAQGGVTVLLSTHDLRNLALFDKVAVLTLGYLAYFGPPDGMTAHFGAATAEEIYTSLPDREERLAEASSLAERFRATPLYKSHCEAIE